MASIARKAASLTGHVSVTFSTTKSAPRERLRVGEKMDALEDRGPRLFSSFVEERAQSCISIDVRAAFPDGRVGDVDHDPPRSRIPRGSELRRCP